MIVKGEEVEVIKTFDVYHCAWECDATGWVVKHNGEKKIVLTNHGTHYFAKVSEITGLISEYADAIKATQAALDMVIGK